VATFVETYGKDWLTGNYLPGIPLTLPSGATLPDALFTAAIRTALATVESRFGLVVDAVTVTGEKHDDARLQYGPPNYAPFQLQKRPVRTLTALQGQFGNNAGVDYPIQWAMKCGPDAPAPDIMGQAELIPTPDAVATLSSYAALGLGLFGATPCWWRWSYTAGWADAADVPVEIVTMVGHAAVVDLAPRLALQLAPLGVTSESGSQDGLSTSVSYNANGTNHVLSALAESSKAQLDALFTQFAGRYRRPMVAIL